MGKVKKLVGHFSQENPDCQGCVERIMDKILYEDGSVESDLTALMRKMALLKRQGAVYKTEVKDRALYEKKMKDLLDDLECMNRFLKYLSKEMPDRARVIQDCEDEMRMYILRHRG